MRHLLALAALCVAGSLAHADPVPFGFGFEDQPLNTPTTSVTIADNGFVFEISRSAGFEFVDLSPFAGDGVPASWGSRTLSPFVDFVNPEPFTLTVLAIPAPFVGLINITAEVGDFLPSDLDKFDFMGEPGFVDNTSPNLFASFPVSSLPLPAETSALPETLTFGGGSPGQEQSLFWDRITLLAIDELPTSVVAPAVAGDADPTGGPGGIPQLDSETEPIPEPGTVLLVGAGAGLIAFSRRRRRRESRARR